MLFDQTEQKENVCIIHFHLEKNWAVACNNVNKPLLVVCSPNRFQGMRWSYKRYPGTSFHTGWYQWDVVLMRKEWTTGAAAVATFLFLWVISTGIKISISPFLVSHKGEQYGLACQGIGRTVTLHFPHDEVENTLYISLPKSRSDGLFPSVQSSLTLLFFVLHQSTESGTGSAQAAAVITRKPRAFAPWVMLNSRESVHH